MGRDSSLVRSISRSANTLKALKSAPAEFGRANTRLVLSGCPRGCGSRAISRNLVMLSR